MYRLKWFWRPLPFLLLAIFCLYGCSKKSTGSGGGTVETFVAGTGMGEEYLIDLSGVTVEPDVLTTGRGRARLSVFGDTLKYRISLEGIDGVTAIDMRTDLGITCDPYGPVEIVLFQSGGSGTINGVLIDSTIVANHSWIQNDLLPLFDFSCVFVHTLDVPRAELAGKVSGGYGSSLATFRYDQQSNKLTYSFSGFRIDGVSGATIHPGGLNQTGPAIATLFGGPTTGEIWADSILIRGELTDNNINGGYSKSELLGMMRSGLAYVRVNTLRYPTGDIRAQIDAQ